MQAFTDLVGTTAVPAHAYDIAELTDLTPTLDTAAVDHGLSVEASEAAGSGVPGTCQFPLGVFP